MNNATFKILATIIFLAMLSACGGNESEEVIDEIEEEVEQSAIDNTFAGRIDIDNLPDYSNQQIPNYISKDNTASNVITDEGATLGRVLFYDKSLSSDNTVSCASCHQQSAAFGDMLQASEGVNGTTGRHSMRLVNARFGEEEQFFWDKRASTLEVQTTQPIQDHVEMGFSGQNGDESITDLIAKLQAIPYYQELFLHAFGSETITEDRMQSALAQFVRSIQSFDTRYDAGRVMVGNDGVDFPNFSTEENTGKQLFLGRANVNNGVRIGGGLGCGACHRAPEFDIDPDSRGNGVFASLSGEGADEDVTRSPTLRDIFDASGQQNGGLMHTGDMTLEVVLDHYNSVPANAPNVDRRVRGQRLMMTADEKTAVVAFIKTLSGSDVYTNEKWSDPFED
ncbi:MAG: cytochrome-c peroxidase [Bacteroidota bacterium]